MTRAPRVVRNTGANRGESISGKKGETKAVEDDDSEVTIKQFIFFQLNKFFVDHIPMESLKELPPQFMYSFGFIAYIAAIGVFSYFTYTSYQDAISSAYISLQDGGGGTCNTVPIQVTGTYLADQYGNWVGSPNFQYSSAMYSITLSNFEVNTFDQYTNMMASFRGALDEIGMITEKQTLAYNLIYWTSFLHYYSVEFPSTQNFSSIGLGQLQYIQMTGDPSEVFELEYQQFSMGAATGYCNIIGASNFDQANGRINSVYNYTAYMSSSFCKDAADPANLGYLQTFDDNTISLYLDIRTFSTIMAVNLGLLNINNLGVANHDFSVVRYESVYYKVGQYFDIRYPTMIPMLCVQNISDIGINPGVEFLCLYTVGGSSTIGATVFNHYGTSNVAPIECVCGEGGNGNGKECNSFNLVSSLMFFNSPKSAVTQQAIISFQIQSILEIITRYNTYSDFNNAAYNATWGGASIAYGKKSAQTKSASFVDSSFDFCHVDKNTQCSMLIWNSYDPRGQAVSMYKYQLMNGSCTNSISSTLADWEKLAEQPPTQLTQNYFECYQSDTDAFLNAVGIATGNTSLAVPLIVLVTLPLIYLVLVAIHQVPPKEEYTKIEKWQAIEIFSLLLLRMRDGKTRGLKPKGVLMQLTKELIAAAKEEGGYPDSDDEYDSDDEDVAEDDDDEEDGEKKPKVKKIRKVRDEDDEDDDEDDDDDDEARGGGGANQRTAPARRSMRRGSVKVKGPTRAKLGVFTKQLEEDNSGYNYRHNNRRGSANNNTNTSMLTGMFRPNHNRASVTTGQELVDMSHTTGRRRSVVNTALIFIDIATGQLPPGVQILNMNLSNGNGAKQKFQRIITGEQIGVLIDDLNRMFTEAINTRRQIVGDNQGSKADLGVIKESDSYQQACLMTERLCKVQFEEFIDSEDITIFFKLSSTLCMHASIEFLCEMNQVESLYSESIAYNVGGKLMTATMLMGLVQ